MTKKALTADLWAEIIEIERRYPTLNPYDVWSEFQRSQGHDPYDTNWDYMPKWFPTALREKRDRSRNPRATYPSNLHPDPEQGTDLDDDNVETLYKLLRGRTKLPPILALEGGQIIEGHHRAAAYQKAGMEPVVVYVTRQEYKEMRDEGLSREDMEYRMRHRTPNPRASRLDLRPDLRILTHPIKLDTREVMALGELNRRFRNGDIQVYSGTTRDKVAYVVQDKQMSSGVEFVLCIDRRTNTYLAAPTEWVLAVTTMTATAIDRGMIPEPPEDIAPPPKYQKSAFSRGSKNPDKNPSNLAELQGIARAIKKNLVDNDESYTRILDKYTGGDSATWMAGGCLILAKALKSHNPLFQIKGLYRSGGMGGTRLEHVFVRTSDGYCLDAMGLNDIHNYTRVYAKYEEMRWEDLTIREFSAADAKKAGIPGDAKAAQATRDMLFGRGFAQSSKPNPFTTGDQRPVRWGLLSNTGKEIGPQAGEEHHGSIARRIGANSPGSVRGSKEGYISFTIYSNGQSEFAGGVESVPALKLIKKSVESMPEATQLVEWWWQHDGKPGEAETPREASMALAQRIRELQSSPSRTRGSYSQYQNKPLRRAS